jgi:hypothetical protein
MKGLALFLALTGMITARSAADAIPYPNSGVENPLHYTFTATSTGHVTAYFAGSSALYDNMLGMDINGTLSSSGFGLDNHTSTLGQSFDLGFVNAGDVLVFVLHNISTQGFPTGAPASLGYAYSDAGMNLGYDNSLSSLGYTTPTSHNHVYSTAYTQSPPIDSIPAGTYVAFEDLPAPIADFNYHDETFVFTNVSVLVPLPRSAWMGLALFAGVGFFCMRFRRPAVHVG